MQGQGTQRAGCAESAERRIRGGKSGGPGRGLGPDAGGPFGVGEGLLQLVNRRGISGVRSAAEPLRGLHRPDQGRGLRLPRVTHGGVVDAVRGVQFVALPPGQDAAVPGRGRLVAGRDVPGGAPGLPAG